MNTSQLHYLLTRDPFVRSQLGGVCAADELPLRVPYRPRVYVVNTDNRGQPGRHWVTLYFPKKGPAEFFDSLGRAPNYYNRRRFKAVMLKNGHGYAFNKIRLQERGTLTCGHYCLYYAFHRCRGWTMNRIVTSLNVKNNDGLVKTFVQSM